MRVIQFLVSRLSFFGFDQRKSKGILKRKQKVVGVHFLQKGSKAYPKELFPLDQIVLIADNIGDRNYTIVSNGYETHGFSITGLTADDIQLVLGDKKWNLDGSSRGNHEDLEAIHITDNVYWYLWSQFYPETEIYSVST